MASTTSTTILHVPHGFQIPAFYTTASAEDVAVALQLGASAFSLLQSTQVSEELRAAEERRTAEVAKLRETHAVALRELQTQLDAAAAARAALQKEYAQQREQCVESTRAEERTAALRQQESLRMRFEADLAVATARYEAAQERKAALEASRDADVRAAEERARALLQLTLEEKERAIQRAEHALQSLQAGYAAQAEEVRALADTIRRGQQTQANVKAKGSLYEALFREKLVTAFGAGDGFMLIDSAANGLGHAGDYLMKWGAAHEHTVLWELKNYDRPVPTAEVEKFRRDMRENAEVRIGVMVSRFTPITGKHASGDRAVELQDGKLLVYLSNFEAMHEETLQGLLLLFRTWWCMDRGDTADDAKLAAVHTIETLHSAALKAKVEWRLHKSRAEEMLRWMSQQVEDHEERLHKALRVLRGTGEGAAGGAGGAAVPDGIFRPCDGDDRAAATIQQILDLCRHAPDSECVLNDLADALGRRKALSRDTAKSHIRAVLLDAAIEPPKGKVPAKVRGLVLRTPMPLDA
jgi:hypothetical protein